MRDSLISWKAKKQIMVAQSYAETEYQALTASTCEVIWIMQLLAKLQVPISSTALIFCDN